MKRVLWTQSARVAVAEIHGVPQAEGPSEGGPMFLAVHAIDTNAQSLALGVSTPVPRSAAFSN